LKGAKSRKISLPGMQRALVPHHNQLALFTFPFPSRHNFLTLMFRCLLY
jgi:hypothetical protein